MIVLSITRPFSATHQIRIAGELEPVHGHEFQAVAEVATSDEGLDAAAIEPALAAVLAELERTHLGEVVRTQAGDASAERIARHVHDRLARELALDRRLVVLAVTVHEAWGCSATYGGPRAAARD